MKTADIFSAVDGYISGLCAQEDEALTAAVRDMREAGLPEISVSPVIGKFLHLMAKLTGACRILEIGTLGGYSAIWLARALPADGRLITLELEPLHAQIARRNIARAGLPCPVEVREGPAAALLQAMIAAGEAPFDMIFIDADKRSYPEYLELSLALSRPGTLIALDNVIRRGSVLDPKAQNSDPDVAGVLHCNSALAKNLALDTSIMQTVGIKGHDGLALARVKASN